VFHLVPAHSGSPGQRAVKWLLLLLLHGRCVSSLAWTSLKDKDQGHSGQKMVYFVPFGGLRAVYVW